MRLELDSQTQLKKIGRRSHVYFQSERILKVLSDTDVETLQKLILGTRVYTSETNPSLRKVCENIPANHTSYSKAVRQKTASLSFFSKK